MLDKDQIAIASRTLLGHWRAGTKLGGLDPTLRPRDRSEGYAIQAEIARSSAARLSGTCHPPLSIRSDDRVAADFGVLGKVSVRFE